MKSMPMQCWKPVNSPFDRGHNLVSSSTTTSKGEDREFLGKWILTFYYGRFLSHMGHMFWSSFAVFFKKNHGNMNSEASADRNNIANGKMQIGDSGYKANGRRRLHVPNVTPLP